MYNLFHKNMNASAMLDCSTSIYKKSFWYQVIASILFSVITSIIVFLLIILFILMFMFLFGFQAFGSYSDFSFMTFGLVIFVVIQLFLLISIFLTCSNSSISMSMLFTSQLFYGEKISLGDAFSKVLKSVPRIFTLSIAQVLIFSVEALVIIGLYLFYFYIFLGFQYSNIDTLSTFAFTLFIVGIIIMTLIVIFLLTTINSYFILALPASLFEKRHFFGAISRSCKLVSKDIWVIAGLNFISFFIVYGIYYSIIIVLQFVPLLINFFLTKDIIMFSTTFPFIYTITTSIVLVLIEPIRAILCATVYFRQKVKHEGFDIEIGVSKLNKNFN